MKHIYFYFSPESVAKERKMTQPFPYRIQKKLIHLSEPGGGRGQACARVC